MTSEIRILKLSESTATQSVVDLNIVLCAHFIDHVFWTISIERIRNKEGGSSHAEAPGAP